MEVSGIFVCLFLCFFVSISDIPNLDLNNSTNPLLKSTFNSSTTVVDIVDIEEHRKLTPSD